jgi:hypothetical protein
LIFRQEKTGGLVYVPFDRPLPHFATPEDLAHLKQAIAAMGERSATYMLTEEGKPRSKKAEASWSSKAAWKAELPVGRSSHGLRRSRMILHAERGAIVHQIAAWSGHETLKKIDRYTKDVTKCRLLTPGPSQLPSWLETGEFLSSHRPPIVSRPKLGRLASDLFSMCYSGISQDRMYRPMGLTEREHSQRRSCRTV